MKRSLASAARGPELVRTKRGTFPGRITTNALKANIGLEEKIKPTYTRNEQTLFENTTKVRHLVEQMENKGKKEDET